MNRLRQVRRLSVQIHKIRLIHRVSDRRHNFQKKSPGVSMIQVVPSFLYGALHVQRPWTTLCCIHTGLLSLFANYSLQAVCVVSLLSSKDEVMKSVGGEIHPRFPFLSSHLRQQTFLSIVIPHSQKLQLQIPLETSLQTATSVIIATSSPCYSINATHQDGSRKELQERHYHRQQ